MRGKGGGLGGGGWVWGAGDGGGGGGAWGRGGREGGGEREVAPWLLSSASSGCGANRCLLAWSPA